MAARSGLGLAPGERTLTEDHLVCFDDEMTFTAGQDLMNAELPPRWLPAGPDDPVNIAFVDRCLGRAPS